MLGHFLAQARLPWLLATVAMLFMLPTLWSGLLGDDLVQRPTQFKPADLPPRLLDTGFVPKDSGQLPTVLVHLFGYVNTGEKSVRARDYGIAPWWVNPGWRAALFRPVTAFTHWLDYRLYPDTPALMHLHSIVWFAAAVFLVASLYRKLAMVADDPKPGRIDVESSNVGSRPATAAAQPPLIAAGLAGCLFLLDPKTYFPVMYVANRGFIIALVFGLLCFHAHINWRTTHRKTWRWLSALCFLLSLLANEGGASTLAFLIPYALVLERGNWRERLATLVPAALVVVGWRTVYVVCGFGVSNFLLYIDPGYEPWLFLKNLMSRANGLLGGQLSGIAPEVALALNQTSQTLLAIGFSGFALLCGIGLVPTLRCDKVSRFWAMVALLAVVPAATVYPISKNMAFIAVGAFGMISPFIIGLTRLQFQKLPLLFRIVSVFIGAWLLVAHVAAASMARLGLAAISPRIPEVAARTCSFQNEPELADREVVIVNDPTLISFVMAFDRAYRHLPLPRSVRTLVPGSTRLQVYRQDTATLTITASEADLFDSPQLGPAHLAYVMKSANAQLFGPKSWKCGERITCKGFGAEVLELGSRGLPRSVAFHFAKPLDSPDLVWTYFDWNHMTHSPFSVPKVGESIEIPGAANTSRESGRGSLRGVQ